MSDEKTELAVVKAAEEKSVLPSGNILPYTADRVAAAVAKQPKRVQEAVLWLLHWGKTHRLSTRELGDLIERDGSSVSQLFTGNYAAKDWTPITDAILEARSQCQSADDIPESEWVPISNALKTMRACKTARSMESVVLLFGKSHSGKTHGLKKFRQELDPETRERKNGQVVIVDMPTGGGTRMFLELLSMALGRSRNVSYGQLRDQVFRCLSADTLLIIDEFTRIFPNKQTLKVQTVELIREIHMLTKAPMVVCGTYLTESWMEGRQHSVVLEQFQNRTCATFRLRDTPTDNDLELLARHWGYPAIPDTTTHKGARVAVREKIDALTQRYNLGGKRGYVAFLKAGAARAIRNREKPAWSDFIAAHDAVERLRLKDTEMEVEA